MSMSKQCRREASTVAWGVRADAKMNADVRQLVAEFALPATATSAPTAAAAAGTTTGNTGGDRGRRLILALRLLSTEWRDAVTAAVRWGWPATASGGGRLTVLQALLCPDMVTDVDSCDVGALIRAALLLRGSHTHADLSRFAALRLPRWTLKAVLERATEHQILRLPTTIAAFEARSFGFANLRTVDLSNLTQLTSLPEKAFVCSTLHSIKLPPSITALEPGAFTFAQSIGWLDMSPLASLTKLPATCFVSARLKVVWLPASVTVLGEACFARAFVDRALDLRNLTSLSGLPLNCFNGMVAVRLQLPPSIAALGERCFTGCHCQELDLSCLKSLTALPRACFHLARISYVTLPATVVSIAPDCFYGAKIRRLDLSRLSCAVLHSREKYLRGASVSHLILREGKCLSMLQKKKTQFG